LTGGMPDQGKSSAARILMVGAMLDPTAELRIWVPDSNYDFEVFRPRCSRYVMGAEDEQIRQIRDDLLELRDEVQTRGELLVLHEEPEVSRALADKGVGLHPLVCLLEEAHVVITHKVYGEEISGLLVDIVRLDRKRLIHLILSTQAPTSTSMPRDVTRNCSNGIAFAVGDHVANDALLGQGAYAAGHRATELIPGTDKGTALVKGFGERAEMVQAYFLSVKRGSDEVTPIVKRSLAEIARRGRVVPGAGSPRAAIEVRDLLDDLDEVLGTERVRLADVPGLLRTLAPHWSAYRSMTGKELGEQLAQYGIRVTKTGNVPRLDPLDVRRALAGQSTADLDG
jgi:S-DNA-T family DNA segregation ATPase FtsK/SpoIIIE